jgi:hypothetical protein
MQGYASETLATDRGLVVAWSTPSGAMLATVPFVDGARVEAVLLGRVDAARRGAPQLFQLARGIGAVWCEADGAYLAIVSPETRTFVLAPYCIVPGARVVAASPGRKSTRLFFHDGEGVLAGRVDPRGDFQRDRERWWSYAAPATGFVAARAADNDVCFATFQDEPALFILFESEGAVQRVRHELSSVPTGLAAGGAGNRIGFGVVVEDGNRLDTGVVDWRGKMIERMGPTVEGRGAELASPRITWMDSGFAALTFDQRTKVATLVRRTDGEVLATFPRASGSPTLTYREKRLVLASVVPSEESSDGARVVVHRAESDGELLGSWSIEVLPPALVSRHRGLELARRLVSELEPILARGTYRERGTARLELANGAALDLPYERQRLEIEGTASGLRVKLVSLVDGADAEPRPLDSFERLARWVREGVSRARRDEALREREWSDRMLAQLGTDGAATQDDHGIALTVECGDAPTAAALAEWMLQVRIGLAERAWRAAPSAPS